VYPKIGEAKVIISITPKIIGITFRTKVTEPKPLAALTAVAKAGFIAGEDVCSIILSAIQLKKAISKATSLLTAVPI
jgi:hypothetical protein